MSRGLGDVYKRQEKVAVYVLAGESTDGWVHAVLGVQHHHWVLAALILVVVVQPFKQGQAVVQALSFLKTRS